MPPYLVWFASSDRKHFGDFRVDELRGHLDYLGLQSDDVPRDLHIDCPYVVVPLPNDEACRVIMERSVLINRIAEVYACGPSVDELLERTAERFKLHPEQCPDASQSFCMRMHSFGVSMKDTDAVSVLSRFMNTLQFQGTVQLKRPDFQYDVLCDYGRPDTSTTRQLKKAFFTRLVAVRGKSMRFSLKTRAYIGPTSTDHQLAQLMAIQVQARPNAFICDPFAGTGSLLVACAYFGAKCVGSDIDWKVVHGKDGVNFRSNFSQYELLCPDIIRSDNSIPAWRHDMRFDGIITDPPYGIRAGARKAGQRREAHRRTVDTRYFESHYAPTQHYDPVDVMRDLLDMAARHLRLGARLVYLLPATADFDPVVDLPSHPSLTCVANSEQLCAGGLCRRLITMVKTSDP